MFSHRNASVIVDHAQKAPVSAVASCCYQKKGRPSSWNWQSELTRLSFCFALAVAVLALATVTALAQEPDGDSESESPGLIAFFSTRDGDYEIYLMNPDGSGLTRLSNDPANNSYFS